MLIRCPHCGFARETPDDRLPRIPARVTCPRCHEEFFLGNGGSEENPADTRAPAPAVTATLAGQPKAGFWLRLVAALADSLLVTIIQFILSFLLLLILGQTGGAPNPDIMELMSGLTLCFSTLTGLVYYIFFTGYCGQTPGKMVLRIKVIRTNGEEMSYARAFLREVIGKFISGIVLGLGYLWVAFDPGKQGWHDKIAKTYVVKLL